MKVLHSMLLAAGASLILFTSACGGQEPMFDRERWAQGRGLDLDAESPRNGMVGDVLALVKPGASRQYVRDLLGEPDGTGPEGDMYRLGLSSVAPETEYLDIRYNADGAVASVDVISR